MEPNSGRVIRASEAPAFEHTPGGYVRFFSGDQHEFGSLTVATSSNLQAGARRSTVIPAPNSSLLLKAPASTRSMAST